MIIGRLAYNIPEKDMVGMTRLGQARPNIKQTSITNKKKYIYDLNLRTDLRTFTHHRL